MEAQSERTYEKQGSMREMGTQSAGTKPREDVEQVGAHSVWTQTREVRVYQRILLHISMCWIYIVYKGKILLLSAWSLFVNIKHTTMPMILMAIRSQNVFKLPNKYISRISNVKYIFCDHKNFIIANLILMHTEPTFVYSFCVHVFIINLCFISKC